MRRFIRDVVFCLALWTATAAAQVSAGFGTVARTYTTGPGRITTGQLAGEFRADLPHALLTLDGSIDPVSGSGRHGGFSASQVLLSPALNGARLITTVNVEREPVTSLGMRTTGTSSASYRRGFGGGWLGVSTGSGMTASLVSGVWRQIGSRASVSIASTLRRGTFGGTPSRFWTEVHFDTVLNDTTGELQTIRRERIFGDSGRAASRLTWAETEARMGWMVGRVALDGVVGWRPRIDTSRQATWVRAYATMAMSRSVAVSIGAGTTTRQLPYAQSTGRFGFAAVRLAPAALVRPKGPPEITPAAAAFTVSRAAGGESVLRVRVPRARVVEISGDFNGWRSLRLTRGPDDVWEATIPLAPGTYRVNLRVDGERWVAPPGLTAVDDEFNGRVGLLVVR